MEFSRPEYWSELPFPSPGDLPNPGIKPRSPTLRVDSLLAEPQGKPRNTGLGSLSLLLWIFPTQESNQGLLHYRWICYQLSYQASPDSSAAPGSVSMHRCVCLSPGSACGFTINSPAHCGWGCSEVAFCSLLVLAGRGDPCVHQVCLCFSSWKEGDMKLDRESRGRAEGGRGAEW